MFISQSWFSFKLASPKSGPMWIFQGNHGEKKWGFQGDECFDLSSGVSHICQVCTYTSESNLTLVGLYFLSISLCSFLKMNDGELARDKARISIQLKSTC